MELHNMWSFVYELFYFIMSSSSINGVAGISTLVFYGWKNIPLYGYTNFLFINQHLNCFHF